MSLSSLIVQREVATMRQVEEALARQVIYGGDLVTNLLEVARIDEGTLTRLLAESMSLTAAPPGELPVAADRVRALVPPEMAAQRSVVPLELEGETLVLAVTEPMPGELEEQLAFALGMTIEQRAAPAVRVKQAIARIYGVPLERRMQRLVARLSGEAPASGSMPPPLGSMPSVMEPPRPPSGPPPGRSTARNFLAARVLASEPAPALAASDPPSALALSTPPLALSTPPLALSTPPDAEPATEASDSAPPSAPLVERRTGLLQREVPLSVRTARRRRGPVTLETAKNEAEEAADRDALLDLFFDFSRQFFDYSVMFLVHGDIAEGRDAFGAGASRERVVGIGVPLDLPGLIAGVRENRTTLVTKAPADGLDAELLADLQRPRDAEVAIVPLVVRTRAVAILVGDCGEHGIDRSSVQQIIGFASVIGRAFERIIVRKKLDGFIAGSHGAAAGRVDPSVVAASLPRKPSRPPSLLSERTGSAPPPTANIASMRPIQGPPIPREEPPDSRPPARTPPAPRARSVPPPRVAPPGPPLPLVTAEAGADTDARMLFDELGWGSAVEDVPPPPPSAAIAVPPHRPPLRHTDPPNELPSVIVDMDRELAAIVERLAQGASDEQAEGELLRQGERAMRVIMAYFPGPLTFERSRIAVTSPPPRPSECGPILRLVTRERKVALPFVLEKLSDQDTETRGWATHALSELPYPEAIAPLLLRLRDVDLGTRVSASYALASVARLYPEEVRAGVLALAHSADPIDRAAAMRVMGELREPSLLPELVRALGDGDEAVVASAHASLVLVTRQDFGLDARPWLRWWELNASRYRIEWLIDALTHEVSEIRRAAGEELRAATKEYFGYASDLPQRDRERAQQRYRDWWVTEGRARFRRKV
jgi:HEAT repeat protein